MTNPAKVAAGARARLYILAQGLSGLAASGEWTRYRALPGQGIEVLQARYVRHEYARHAHDAYCLGVTETGAQAFSCRGAGHVSAAGQIMAFNPDEPHDGHALDEAGFTYCMIYLTPGTVQAVLSDAAERPAGLPWARVPVIDDPLLGNAILRLHRRFAEATAEPLARDAALIEVVTGLAGRHADWRPGFAQGGDDRDAVARVHALIADEYAEPLTLDRLAAEAGLSRFHLSRLFQRRYGLPPHAYQLRLRLAEARRLIAAGEPVAEVAVAVGFVDQSHLGRRFKAAFGITPGAFARSLGQ